MVAEKKAHYPLVLSKLNRPVVNRRWIVRPRLLSAMDEALSRKLALISAPAGYGKTTLTAQWLEHIPPPSAWISLDENDADPDRFFTYVVASIRKIFPNFGPQIGPLLSSPTLPPADYLVDTLISDLAHVGKPMVLVLDDLHTIASKPIHTMIIRLVQYLPDHLHLVIATRVDPPLPLAQWRVKNWLTEIRGSDLRFFSEEALAFFGAIKGEKLSDDASERILARTEGWIAGLQMVRLSLAEADNPEVVARSIAGSNRMIVEYLIDEVVSRQTDEIKEFLTVTALLDRFCAPLCDHVLEDASSIPDSSRLITILAKKNLFLVALDEGTWYRYHQLFRALLIRQMESALPKKQQNRIHYRAGEWFANQGYIDEGLRHLIAAGDLDKAAALVEENMHGILDQDLSRRTLGRWLDMFPEEAEKLHPALLVAHAFQKIVCWDLDGMVPLLDQAESLLKDPACSIPESRRQILSGDIAVQRACALYWQGDAEGTLRHALHGRQIVPKKHRYAHALAVVYASGAAVLRGETDDALLMLDEALAVDCSDGSPNAAFLLASKATIFLYSADLVAVEKSARKILEVHETARQSEYWLGYAPYFLGVTAYERNLLDVAANQFGRLEQMRYRVNTRLYHDALIGLTLVALAKSDRHSAENYAAEAYSFAVEANDALSLQISESIQLRLTLCSENVPTNPAPYKPAVDSTWFWLEFPSLTHAENLVNRGNHRNCNAGLESIEKGLQMARCHRNTRLAIQYLAVKAVALAWTGRINDALELLNKTLSLAEPHGLVRTFLDRGPTMAELLRALSERHSENLYAKSLLDAFGDKLPPEELATDAAEDPAAVERPVDAFLASGLTNRELDVLLLLSKRLTNKEIAERLYISPITVKSHTANIYRKLRVHDRREVVVRARQLGLLAESSA